MTKWRAETALKIDDIRAALSNPNTRPVVVDFLYSTMVFAKLGFNLAHGMVNITQTLTNTFPKIGGKYMARGISRFFGDRNAIIHASIVTKSKGAKDQGRTVQQILDESGIIADVPAVTEFSPTKTGTLTQKIMDVGLTPAKVSEEFNRTVSLMGAYEKAIDNGASHSHALQWAVDMVQKTQFPFNRAGTPPIVRTPFVRLLMMFKAYPMHQLNFSAEMIEDALGSIQKKGITVALKEGDLGPLRRHMLAYLGLFGGAALMFPDTNMHERTQHPMFDITNFDRGRDPVLETLGGPPASALLDILHGQIQSGIEEFTNPTFMRNLERAYEQRSLTATIGF